EKGIEIGGDAHDVLSVFGELMQGRRGAQVGVQVACQERGVPFVHVSVARWQVSAVSGDQCGEVRCRRDIGVGLRTEHAREQQDVWGHLGSSVSARTLLALAGNRSRAISGHNMLYGSMST